MDTVQRMLVTVNVSIYLGSSAEFLYRRFFAILTHWKILQWLSSCRIITFRKFYFSLYVFTKPYYSFILYSFIFLEFPHKTTLSKHYLDNKSSQRFNQIFILSSEKLNYSSIFRSFPIQLSTYLFFSNSHAWNIQYKNLEREIARLS